MNILSASRTAPLWTPTVDSIERSSLTAFSKLLFSRHGFDCAGQYSDLHKLSVDHPELFWPLVAEYVGINFSSPPTEILSDRELSTGVRWFNGAKLNYAEQLLKGATDKVVVVALTERGDRTEITNRELRESVGALRKYLLSVGVKPNDVVAGVLTNGIAALYGLLASASIGAIWSCCSPEFGAVAVIDRFFQLSPKVLLASANYRYGGKDFSVVPKLVEIVNKLPSVSSVVLSENDSREEVEFDCRDIKQIQLKDIHEGSSVEISEQDFLQLPFSHPLAVLFSSGTTGSPKGIIHSAGGTLLQHLKELALHIELTPSDRFLYYTTTGWMMWNWAVSSLAIGSTLYLYDGSPVAKEIGALFEIAKREQITVLGTSASYLGSLMREGRRWNFGDLDNLRVVLSTGSPLSAECFDYFYEHIAPKAKLSSISGGTDIISCFMLGCSWLPVYRGEIQCAGLGMDVGIVDDRGLELESGVGELVCRSPFPSMPVGFVGGGGDRKYRETYFERFPGMWHHGDLVERTVHNGFVIHGRSDAVLNPNGIRFGTAEIYNSLISITDIRDMVAVGIRDGSDEEILLAVVMKESESLSDKVIESIRMTIRQMLSPRHVPKHIIAVSAVPRTFNGKLAEIAARTALNGEIVRNQEALVNPECLNEYTAIGLKLRQEGR